MKKHIVINRRLIWFFLIFLILAALGLLSLSDADGIGAGIALLLFSLFFLIITIWFAPLYFVFDRDGVCICYTFGRYETGKWAKIRKIWLELDGYKWPYTYTYHLTDLTGNRRHILGTIPKTRRTTRLILQYWQGAIEGEKPPRFAGFEPDDREATAAESTARSRIKSLLKTYRPPFGNRGVLLSHTYWYSSGDGDGNVRPKMNYEFVAEIELKDEKAPKERVCYLSDVLLSVRCTKERYIPYVQEDAYVRLAQELDRMLAVLKQNGADTLFAEPEEPTGFFEKLRTRFLIKLLDWAEKNID